MLLACIHIHWMCELLIASLVLTPAACRTEPCKFVHMVCRGDSPGEPDAGWPSVDNLQASNMLALKYRSWLKTALPCKDGKAHTTPASP